jgi:hypothetical protein
LKEKFENNKGVIQSHKSQKDRQHHGQRIRTNNDQQKNCYWGQKKALVVYVQLGELNTHFTLRMESK